MRDPAIDLFDVGNLDGPAADTVRRLAIAGFHALWRGRTPTLAELVGTDSAVLDEVVEHLRARGRIELSADGHILAVHGLSHRTTRHRIEHHGGGVNTWCALDAIGIPAALRIDACALTQCPICGRQLAVTLVGGEPEPLPGALLWYPETVGCCGHLLDEFCSGANLFCSLDHLQRWVGDHAAAGTVITIDQVAEVGRETWADVAHPSSADAGEAAAGRLEGNRYA